MAVRVFVTFDLGGAQEASELRKRLRTEPGVELVETDPSLTPRPKREEWRAIRRTAIGAADVLVVLIDGPAELALQTARSIDYLDAAAELGKDVVLILSWQIDAAALSEKLPKHLRVTTLALDPLRNGGDYRVLVQTLHDRASIQSEAVTSVAAPPDFGARRRDAYVFVSYSRADRAFVDRLIADLDKRRVRAWVDHGIEHGSRWVDVIQRQIDGCAALLVVMTPDSRSSEWVQNELLYAKSVGKPIFPVLVAGELWLQLISIQHEDVTGGGLPTDRFVEKLRAVVDTH